MDDDDVVFGDEDEGYCDSSDSEELVAESPAGKDAAADVIWMMKKKMLMKW